MKIYIGTDHRGIEIEEQIVKYLKENNIKVEQSTIPHSDTDDYVDFAKDISDKIVKDKDSYGILICGTGIGMSIAANKVKNILAAKVNTPKEAALCREHNMANVMTLAEYTENLEAILDNYISTQPSTEERHIRRVEKVLNIEG